MASFHNWVLETRLTPDLADPLVLADGPPRAFRTFDRELLGMPEPPIDPRNSDASGPLDPSTGG
jgi:hypothetical protein